MTMTTFSDFPTEKKPAVTLTRADTHAWGSNGSKRIIDLKSLNPDADGDGKVKASERDVHNMLLNADVDKDGYLSIDEFYQAMTKFSAVQQSRQMFKRALCGVSVLFLLQTFVVAILVVCVAVAFKDTYVSQEGEPTMHNGKDKIVGVAEALISLPLFVAPVLSLEKLSKVKAISVRYYDSRIEKEVNAGLRVAEFRRVSDTEIYFITETPGRQLEIKNGDAMIVDYVWDEQERAMVRDWNEFVCEADATCSAITAAGEDVQALVDAANAALVEAGLEEIEYDVVSRRQLAGGNCGPWVEQPYTTTKTITAMSTEDYNRVVAYFGERSMWQFCNHPKIKAAKGDIRCLKAKRDENDGYMSECDRVKQQRSTKLTIKSDGTRAWCRDTEGKYNVPCKEKWGSTDGMKKFVANDVVDGAFFCGEDANGDCQIEYYRRGCNAQEQIASAIEAAEK